MTQRASIGRTVHYVLKDGQHRAATVVNAFHTRANLTVHLDGCNDLQPGRVSDSIDGTTTWPNPQAYCCKNELAPIGASNFLPGVLTVGSAQQDEDTKASGSWHFPEREA